VNQPPLFFLFSLFLMSSLAHANELFFSFNQEIQSFYLTPQNSSTYFARSELLTKGEVDLIKNLKFKLDASAGTTFMKNQDQQSFLFNPVQLGVLTTQKYFELFIGGFTLAGEGADVNNIFNVVNAQDFRQPFNSKSIGSYGVLLTIPLDSFTAKAFYIPKNQKSILPDTQSAWWPRTEALPISNASGTFLSPDNMSYKLTSQSEEKNPFENNYDATAKYSFSNVDLSLFYFSGVNQIPKISPHINLDIISGVPLVGIIKPPVELNLTWFRSEHVGGGATVVLGDWIAKIFLKSQKDILPQDEQSTSGTASIESSFALSRFSLRYFLQANRIWKQTSTVQELETLLGFFERSTALGIYLDMNSGGTVSGAAIYNEKDPSVLVSLGYEYRFTDQFKTKLSANVLTSSGSNPLAKAYDRTDNLSLTLNYDF
jgi:hypothetical protein